MITVGIWTVIKMKKLFIISVLIICSSCSKEQNFNCLDIYEVTLSKNKEFIWFKLKNDNTRYKAAVYSEADNQIIYSVKLGRRDRSFRYIPEKNSLSIITGAGDGECIKNS
jgi:hypothetical protein